MAEDPKPSDDETNAVEPPSRFDTEPPVASMRPVLMVFDQNKLHEWYLIVQETTIIGRQPGVDVTLNDDAVSRQHARIEYENINHAYEEPRCVLHDEGSRNGILFNGQRLAEPVVLRTGDRFFVGNTCLAYFVRTDLEISQDRKLRNMATTDSLTGLMNRGYMAIQFKREFDRSRRYRRPLSLMMIDIDDFKKINDTFGHKAGDDVLQELAHILQQKTRIHDLVARYGGEEMSILLPETNLQSALVIAERIRRMISSHDFPSEDQHIHLSVSIGVAELDAVGQDTLDELLNRADKALYTAKKSGKDRVCSDDVEPDPNPV